ncbi:C-type mannose receptor 2-like [Lineus longissimus]|uniref:C-type mannose receptor 2-like n=1 Tax=Lineus longissimus TaxID=88925 RepID=UPI002B4D1427
MQSCWIIALLIIGFVAVSVTSSSKKNKCPSGYRYLMMTKSCYKLYTEKKTYDEARRRCQDVHPSYHLVSIADKMENSIVQYYAMKSGSVWIGIRKTRSSAKDRWDTGDKVTYKRWSRRHPRRGTCGSMRSTSGFWDVKSCSKKTAYICKGKPVTKTRCMPGYKKMRGGCYKLFEDQVHFHLAEIMCRRSGPGYHVTSIKDKSDNQMVVSLLKGTSKVGNYWIGLERKPTTFETNRFKWIDGKPVSFFNWGKGQPDNKYGKQYCTVISRYTGKWSDFYCNSPNNLAFVCRGELQDKSTIDKFVAKMKKERQSIAGTDQGCPLHYLRVNTRCYRLYTTRKSFDAAAASCTKDDPGFHLATASYKEKNDIIRTFVRWANGSSLWIGFKVKDGISLKHQKWFDGKKVVDEKWVTRSYTNTERCGVMTSSGQWNRYVCFEYVRLPFACEGKAKASAKELANGSCPKRYTKGLGSCYKVNRNRTNRKNAARICQKDGKDYHLVTITSERENLFLMHLTKSVHLTQWIGLRKVKPRTYAWDNKEPFSYSHWKPGVLKYAETGRSRMKTCTSMSNGQWKNEYCVSLLRLYFICEGPVKV